MTESPQVAQVCWRNPRADRLAVLVDGAGYFGALRRSLMEARHTVYIVGWDVDSRTPVAGTEREPDDGAPVQLREFLTHLVRARPELTVRILLWDYSVLLSLEREPLPRIALDWRTPSQITVCLDDELPFGASHHQKIVVVDDTVAFVGGLDLTLNRWDTPEHRPDDARRATPDGSRYGPFHDVQMVVDGAAARSVSELVRVRWQRASGQRLDPVRAREDPWPHGVEPDLEDIRVAIARTVPPYEDQAGIREIEASYLEMIAAARRSIYIENQYLTAPSIAEALLARLKKNTRLELIAVCPEAPGGWLEAQAMGAGLRCFMEYICEESVRSRVRFLQPTTSDDEQSSDLMVHAKVMIVDDTLLRVGSSNLNNRSMGVDTECDLIAQAETPAHERAIARVRARLLAEHLGTDATTLQSRTRANSSLIDTIEALGTSERRLRPVCLDDQGEDALSHTIQDFADPEQPLEPADFIGDAFGAASYSTLRRRLLRLSVAGGALLALVLLWHVTPLSGLTDLDLLDARLGPWRDSNWAPPLLLLGFVLASLLVFPITVLIMLAAMLFGPWQGFVIALLGALAGAGASYGLGALLGKRLIDALFGRFRHSVSRSLKNHGITAVLLLRVVPIAPFTVVNVLLGSSSISFRDYLLGTLLGMTPGIAVITVLGDRLRAAWLHPDPTSIALLLLAIAVWIGAAICLQAAVRRFSGKD